MFWRVSGTISGGILKEISRIIPSEFFGTFLHFFRNHSRENFERISGEIYDEILEESRNRKEGIPSEEIPERISGVICETSPGEIMEESLEKILDEFLKKFLDLENIPEP